MPLRITDGIPLRPEPAPPPPPVHPMILADTAAQPAAAPANPLPIAPVAQRERLWCWTACVEMVLNSVGDSVQAVQQCEIISQIPSLNAANCCGNEDTFADKALAAAEMQGVWSSFGIQSVPHLKSPVSTGQINFDDVKTEIQEKRPIEVAVRWFEGGSHALIIKGFGQIGGRPSVWINDPLMNRSLFSAHGGEGQILFSELKTANNYGRWVSTWTGLKK